jgi:PhzF family phenazine biosynthesis protein
MKQRLFAQVDVFTDTAYLGNPLAIVLNADGLSDAAMQNFARWTNLSETTFVLKPSEAQAQAGADYAVRIFTPGGELPFAGHPTLGSCHAWLQAGGRPQQADAVIQACRHGLVTIDTRGPCLAFAAPALQRSAVASDLLVQVAQALGIEPAQIHAAQLLDNGPRWLGLLLDEADTVMGLEPDHARLRDIGYKVGVIHLDQMPTMPGLISRSNREARAFTHQANRSEAMATTARVRAFAAPMGVPEDPVTGSLNASLAQWLIASGHAPMHYTAIQGERLGRYGQVHVRSDAQGQVWVGGEVVGCISGHVLL